MSDGIPRLLFLDNAKCHIPTDHTSLNSRDEVYFLVAGGTSGGQQIKVAPDPDHNDEDYYPVASGQSIGNIVLAQADMSEGDRLAFTVVMCDQDNAQLERSATRSRVPSRRPSPSPPRGPRRRLPSRNLSRVGSNS